MAEFRPPVRAVAARRVIAAVLLVLVIVPLGALVFFLTGPMQIVYRIADGKLHVESGDRMSGSRAVDLSTIAEATPVQLQGGRRTMGTAFSGFCAGKFHYSNLGDVWQATDCSRSAVVVRASTVDLPIVMTPPDPAGFVERLRQGEATHIVLPAPDKTELNLISLVVVPIALITGIVVLLVFTGGAEKMVYRVDAGQLEVATMFSRKRWPTAGMRARKHRPRTTLRIMGTAAPGYYTGLFRQDGTNTRVFATDLKEGILIETTDRVYLSPESPDAFLQALERAGAEVTGG